MIAAVAGLVAAGLTAGHLASCGLVARRLGRPPRGQVARAGVTLLRPVCGLDAFDAQTLQSSFGQDWPEYEVIFCAPSEDDPAVPLVRALIAAHPGARARLLCGQVRRTGNPKLDNLWKGWAAARGEFVCMADSNLLLPPDYLSGLMAEWGGGLVGLVSSPPVGLWPEGWGGALECAFLNGNQARLQLAADEMGQGYAQGKTLMWHRATLEDAGGLAALGRWLAEDAAATKLVRGMGRRVRLAPRPFGQPIGRRSLRAVWDRQLRWSRVRRDAFPGLFLAEIANGAVAPAALALMAGGPALALAGLVLWYGAEAALVRRAGWPMGWRDLAALPLRDLMLPVLWLATFARRGITWRGTAMAAPAAAVPPAAEAPGGLAEVRA